MFIKKGVRFSLLRVILLCLFCGSAFSASKHTQQLPVDIREGLLEYHLDRKNYFSVLTLLQAEERKLYPLHVAIAQYHLGLDQSFSVEKLDEHVRELQDSDGARLRLASLLYSQGDCKNALKYLKGKAKGLNSALQTQRAYLRAQCFIQLGNNNFAAQALSQALEGEWAATAYYNLAADYAATSSNPRRALLSLKVARDINQGNDLSELELTNRINLSAGALYLDNDKPELANEFFNQIAMDSVYVTQALYLSGLAKNATQDYRGAIQSWLASQQFGLASPGVAESLIAIPHAQSASGFQTDALESFIKASKQFQDEQENIAKLITAIDKYGAIEVLLEEKPRAELQWFLDRSNSTNTQRAMYMRYLGQSEDLMALFEEYSQIKSIDINLENQLAQLASLKQTLSAQLRVINSKQSKANFAALQANSLELKKRIAQLEAQMTSGDLQKTHDLVAALEERLGGAQQAAKKRAEEIPSQISEIEKASKRIAAVRKRIDSFFRKLDKEASALSKSRLSELKLALASYYEQAELGLVQILEVQARLRTKRTNLLDGRYQ